MSFWLGRSVERYLASLLPALLLISTGLLGTSCQRLLEPSVEDLIAHLGDSSPEVRNKAAWALGEKGIAASSALDPLIETLKSDENWQVRHTALSSLVKIDPRGEKIIDALVAALQDPHPRVKFNSVISLHGFGGKAAPAVPGLIDLVQEGWQLRREYEFGRKHVSGDNLAQYEAATSDSLQNAWSLHLVSLKTLGAIGAEARAAVPVLIQELGVNDPQAKISAMVALGNIGPAAHQAGARLSEMLSSSDDDTRRYAAWAVGRIGYRPAVSQLARLLDDRTKDVRANAAASLKLIATDEAVHALDARVESLLPLLQDRNWDVRREAAETLQELDTPRAQEALKAHLSFFPDHKLQ